MTEKKKPTKTKAAAKRQSVVAANPNRAVMGRPTKYKPEYCQTIVDFFNVEPYTVDAECKKQANDLPLIEKFAHSIDVTRECLHEWKRTYPDFSDAFQKAKALQQSMWATNSMLGLYSPAFTIFFGKNIYKWTDRQSLEHTGKDGGPIQSIEIALVGVDDLTNDLSDR